MGSHTLDVEISGWADIASMQEQVAHLPDAVRRDRWFDNIVVLVDGAVIFLDDYLTIRSFFFFFFSFFFSL